MVRVCADLATLDADPAENRVARWRERLAPWTEQMRAFRNEGFYERFPAKGQVERVARIHRELARQRLVQALGEGLGQPAAGALPGRDIQYPHTRG